jgi:hypothetical protein
MSPSLTRCSCCNAVIDGVKFRVGRRHAKLGTSELGWCAKCSADYVEKQAERESFSLGEFVDREVDKLQGASARLVPMSEQIRAALKAKLR